jgi:hypothetical protein
MFTAQTLECLRYEIEASQAERYMADFLGSGRLHDSVTARERRDFWALDIGTSGAFMVRKADGAIFGIKGYGTPDYRKGIAFIGEMDGAEVLSYRFKRGPFRTDMREPQAVAS